MRKLLFVISLILIGLIFIIVFIIIEKPAIYNKTNITELVGPIKIHDQNISGEIRESQIWSGKGIFRFGLSSGRTISYSGTFCNS